MSRLAEFYLRGFLIDIVLIIPPFIVVWWLFTRQPREAR